jgi:hypothetical protein
MAFDPLAQDVDGLVALVHAPVEVGQVEQDLRGRRQSGKRGKHRRGLLPLPGPQQVLIDQKIVVGGGSLGQILVCWSREAGFFGEQELLIRHGRSARTNRK